jgi:hypothetical protein
LCAGANIRFWPIADIPNCTMSAFGGKADRLVHFQQVGIRVWARAANVAPRTKGAIANPPALDPIGCLISATDKRLQLRRATLYPAELRARVGPQ